MTETPLTPERILEAAEEVLRRYGPAKATVVDVARALGVSHGSVYRHFPSKAALRDAVTERWLARVAAPLAVVAAEEGPAPERLERWLRALMAEKQGRHKSEPELFATYVKLVGESGEVVGRHVKSLTGQLARIVADGIEQGCFTKVEPAAAAKAVFDATARFHNPVHAGEWAAPDIGAAFEGVFRLILRGLGAAEEAAPAATPKRRGERARRPS